MATYPTFEILEDGSRYFVLHGELDMSTEPVFEQALRPIQDGAVVLEISALTFIDSSGLRAVLAVMQRLNPGCVILHGASAKTSRLLALTRTDHLPTLHVLSCEVLAA